MSAKTTRGDPVGAALSVASPRQPGAAYAYYVVAVSYYEQIADVERDQKTTGKALDALQELIRRYPNTQYAADARLKVDLTRDHLAGKEMEVGRFYQRNKQFLAAVLRFRTVVDTYNTTSHTPRGARAPGRMLSRARLARGGEEGGRRPRL